MNKPLVLKLVAKPTKEHKRMFRKAQRHNQVTITPAAQKAIDNGDSTILTHNFLHDEWCRRALNKTDRCSCKPELEIFTIVDLFGGARAN